MKISGRTRAVALLGCPVEHTLSPAMHNAAFEELGLDYRYMAFHVEPNMLRNAIAGIRAMNFAGLNVTVPHKENVMEFLDEVDEEAVFIGAVNTVVNRNGSLVGYNTDGRGFMRGLSEGGLTAKGKRVFISGAGGGARAIGYYLCKEAAGVSIYDIDSGKALRLVSDLKKIGDNVEHTTSLDGLRGFEVVINATPLGLSPDDPPPFDLGALSPDALLVELIYKSTRLQGEAAKKGIRTLNGLGMLLWQGALAFELWTGATPPHQVMRKALLEGLK